MRRGSAPRREDRSGRIHEVFGILTLACGLLLGPSLASVQFGDGTLMGPFGQTVGQALNWLLGLSGYLLVLGLLVVALRIFAGGLGLGAGPARPPLWRERIGVGLGLWSGAVLLHLVFRPERIAEASAGGFVGELGAEVLCSLVSTPGTWVITLSAAALAVVLATNISWARLGLALLRLALAGLRALGVAGLQGTQNLRRALGNLAEALRRRPMEEEISTSGTLALPPVVRLDLTHDGPGEVEEAELADPAPAVDPRGLPEDLEIGGDEPDEAEDPADGPLIHAPELPPPPRQDDVEAEDPPRAEEPAPEIEIEFESEPEAEAEPAPRSGGRNKGTRAHSQSEAEEPGLTIVEERYDRRAVPAADAEPAEKEVEQSEGPGYVLHGETYRPPPLSLLEYELGDGGGVDRAAIYAQADRLVKTLADYKIDGRITEVHPGPVITMYEFVPAPGTRISKVAGLANDLAMSLAAQRVRIVAPIPGKGAIGIEVPNKCRETVYFKEIVASDAFRKGKSVLNMAMGKNIFGAPVTLDLAKMPHLLVAGATGAGKSVSINAMICSLLLNATPEEVRLIMVDPKFLELSGYNDIPHLMLPVVTDPKKANTALRWAVAEMERRYQLLADMRVRDIKGFNRKVDKQRGKAESELAEAELALEPLAEEAPARVLVVRRNADGSEVPVGGEEEPREGATAEGEATEGAAEAAEAPEAAAQPEGEGVDPAQMSAEQREARRRRARARRKLADLPERLPYIVVVIDEFADLMMVASKEVETSVARLAQKARAAGIHVILATQRPSVDVITGLIKANFPSRVSFQVASTHDSKTILGCHGAENLLGAGDMLVLDRGADMKRLHGAYISDAEIQRVVDWLREQGKPVYDMDILKPEEEEAEAPSPEEEAADPMYDQAVALVAETQQASISMIQRRLRVGYNRAARMVEMMEREGIVSAPDGVKGREVLIQHHE